MPKMDGMTALAAMREKVNVPVIFLTAKSEEMDMILGLNVGADDYITKPFHPVELLARVKSQIRRYTLLGGSGPSAAEQERTMRLGNIEMDEDAKVAKVDGEDAHLTRTEYDILHLLMEQPGKVLSPKEIYGKVWQEAPIGGDNIVAVHIRHLREKIEIDPSKPRYLKVVWGRGYKLEG